ncbi:hypothetical protein IQ260_08790 [Leptolyngbya cf. ectocarpi LEGE 11479]|uniref:Uncharacterized protein n=1 Tax=Leptolyngbya cf. ectocarpi LEGE 11479 TaxID=1828722 RepID=A0A928ZRM0_LEPEC|nr:hypothetical protein [Leptolyngbya ectocarpi]MBE9066748.1 hypothetical protein [Leptolyngbya cf. ectocarpi LEGE 11479]
MTLLPDHKQSRQTRIYPDNTNYALYELIWALGIVMLCLFTAVALINHS